MNGIFAAELDNGTINGGTIESLEEYEITQLNSNSDSVGDCPISVSDS